MSPTATEVQSSDTQPEVHDHSKDGQVVVHAFGSKAGSIRLDIDCPHILSAEEAKEVVKLELPGEVDLLNAGHVVGANGHFVISYFSADIANAGHLPAEAVAVWSQGDQVVRSEPVKVIDAPTVEREDGKSSARVPGGKPTDMYPMTVILVAVLGVMFLAAYMIGVLTIG